MNPMRSVAALACAIGVAGAACGSGSQSDPAGLIDSEPPARSADVAADEAQMFPDVIDAVATETDGMWSFDVTISSPYDSPERYADAWRILGADGTVFGIRELTHDHASEQPFTRSLGGIAIPDTVTVVTIEGRDKEFGWGGTTLDVALSR
jgi:hypothetical protein